MNLLVEYIKYRWKAKGRHGTHSPFMYEFVDQCLTFKIPEEFKKSKTIFFDSLKHDQELLSIEDHGAGSKRLREIRKVSDIYKTSGSKGKYGDLLYKLSSYYKPKNVLELGTSVGIGSFHLINGNPESNIITVEGCSETHKRALKSFRDAKISNLTSVHSTFNNFLDHYNGEKFDLVFIDGHHDGQALQNYLRKLDAYTHNDTMFILDDIRWSKSMFDAWTSIIKDSEIHVSIDLFRMGIILKRPQQVKEDFIVKL